MHIKPTEQVTAITLLNCFDAVCPRNADAGLWDEADEQHSPLSLYRLRQLKSLFRAFDIRFDPRRFADGSFVFDRLELYQPLLERLGRPLTDEKRRRHRPNALPILFSWLREYRRGVLRAKDSYQIFLSCPPAVWRFLEDVVQPLADSIAKCLSPIDAVLSELIAPDGRTFTLEALIADHGHPTEDYSDLEWAEEEAFWRAAFGDDEEDIPEA